jgi:hypothetical protein
MSKIVKDFETAKKRGLTFYYPDKLCSKGHKSKRYTNDKKCVECVRQRSKIYGKIWFQKNKIRLREIRKKHAQKNRKKYVEYQKQYRKKNPESYKETILKGKEKRIKSSANWYQKNKKKILIKKYKRLKEDYIFRLKELVRSRIQSGLRHNAKNIKKGMRSIMYLGCSYQEYMLYLEKKFNKGMNWSNMGGKNGWQIDHIKPLVKFDLSKKSNQLKAFNYKNTQPMWIKDNLSKGGR